MAKGEIEDLLDVLDPEVVCRGNDGGGSAGGNGAIDWADRTVESGESINSSNTFGGFDLAQGHLSHFDARGRNRAHTRTIGSGGGGTVGRFAQTSYNDKVLASHMRRVRAASEKGGLSVATIRATENVMGKVVDAPSMRRAQKSGVVEGAVFIASRQCASPRTAREVAHMFGVCEQIVTAGVRKVNDAMACVSSSVVVLASSAPDAYIPRFIAALMDRDGVHRSALVGSEVRCIALAKALSLRLDDESPAVIAAAAIATAIGYTSAKHIGRIAEASGVRANALKRCLAQGVSQAVCRVR
jgi:hypothetical protein